MMVTHHVQKQQSVKSWNRIYHVTSVWMRSVL